MRKKVIFKSFCLNSKKEMMKWVDIYISCLSTNPNTSKKNLLKDPGFNCFIENEEEAWLGDLSSCMNIATKDKKYNVFSLKQKFFKEGYSSSTGLIDFKVIKDYFFEKIIEIYDKNGNLYIDLYATPNSKKTTLLIKESLNNELKKANLLENSVMKCFL